MPTDVRVLLSWSSGKDSAWSLHELRRQGRNVVGLLTTLNESAKRVAMHAVRRELLRKQAEAVRLPLTEVELPWPCDNATYEERVNAELKQQKQQLGITHLAFGDIFLQDVRAYRERQAKAAGLVPLFPLWGQATDTLSRAMLAGGLRARITCLDPQQLDRALAGSSYDAEFLASLPASADPCGENGEFHSFAWDGPMFSHPINCRTDVTVERDGFVYTDVLPTGNLSTEHADV